MLEQSTAVTIASEGISQLGPQLGEFFCSLPPLPFPYPHGPLGQRGSVSPSRTFLAGSPDMQGVRVLRTPRATPPSDFCSPLVE